MMFNTPRRTGCRTDRRLRGQLHRNDDRYQCLRPVTHFHRRAHAVGTFPLRRPRS